MINPWPVLLAEARRSAAGMTAVVVLIGLAVGLGVAVSAQERALRQGSGRAADRFDLLLGAPGSPTQLVLTTVYLQPATLPLIDGRVLEAVQADPGIAWAAPVAFGDYHRTYSVVGTTARLVSLDGTVAVWEGRLFDRMAEAVVGADVALPLGYRFSPSHGQPHALEEDVHEGLEYTVVGRMPRQGTPWDRAILVPIQAVWHVHGLAAGQGEGSRGEHCKGRHIEEGGHADEIGDRFGGGIAGVPAIVVKPKSVGDAYRLRAAFRSEHGVMALFPAEVMVELYGLLGDARTLLTAIAAATETLVVLAVLLAILAGLAARRGQIATLRALGASRTYLFVTIWLQASLLILAGGALGVGLGWAGALAMSSFVAAETGLVLPVALGRPELLMLAGLLAGGCVLAVIPALAGYRTPVAASLRR